MEEITTYHDVEGEKVSFVDLRDGDRFAARVSWYDWDESKPLFFTVTEEPSDMAKETAERGEYTPMGDVKAEGEDGHKYKFYLDNAHVECLTDDKKGYDRGTKAARPKKVEE